LAQRKNIRGPSRGSVQSTCPVRALIEKSWMSTTNAPNGFGNTARLEREVKTQRQDTYPHSTRIKHKCPMVRCHRTGPLCANQARTVRKAPVGPDVVACVAIWISFQIILMFRLGLPKGTSRFYGRYDFSGPNSRGIDVGDGVFRSPLLLVVGIEDRGTIAGSAVVCLPIHRRRIMYFKL
jgi:hypothetical protein